MILNRFSRNLGIMYASPSCELIFKLEPDEIVGRPFLLFIRSDDLATFVEQVDLAKSTNAVTHMRFWFQSPRCAREIPCEAMLFGAADGMIAIMRRCKPFVRRHLLTAGLPNYGTGGMNDGYGHMPRRDESSSEYFASSSSTESSFGSSQFAQSMDGYDGFSQQSTNPISPIHGSRNSGIYSGMISTHAESISSCSSSHTSSTTSSSAYAHHSDNPSSVNHNSSYSNTSFSSYSPCTYSYRAPLRGLPVGSINSIRNLDRDHSRLRPLTSLQQDDPTIVDGTTPLPEAYRMRTHHMQELDLDEDDDDDDDDNNEQDDGDKVDVQGHEIDHERDHEQEHYQDQGYVYEYPYRPVRADVGHFDLDVDDSGLDMELEELDLESEPRAYLVEIEDGEEVEELEMPRSTRHPGKNRDRPGGSGSGHR
ncbi:unnamed protein product [Mortierella alpina]